MFRPRLISTAIALLASFGAAALPSHVMAPPAMQIASRSARIPRRTFARRGAPLPGKKGRPQKHYGKTCHQGKPARSRRRAARMRGA